VSRGGDPELHRLLIEELVRHGAALEPERTVDEQRRALHALKGSAAVAGERTLADALARLERRLVAGDGAAAEDARALVAHARAAFATGAPIDLPQWPVPPDDLLAQPVDAAIYGHYVSETQDRLDRLDRALATEGEDVAAAAAAYREVHAIKSAALAAADEVTAWFCHGLEERLRLREPSMVDARRALDEASRWRAVLGETIVAPERALESLRVLSWPIRRSTRPPFELRHHRTPTQPMAAVSGEGRASRPDLLGAGRSGAQLLPPRRPMDSDPDIGRHFEEATLRVGAGRLDRLFERVRQLAQSRTRVTQGASSVHAVAGRTRKLRERLVEALRLIGPPRLWGAPAAAIARIDSAALEIGTLAEQLDREAAQLGEVADQVRSVTAAAHGDLAEMRTTSMAGLLERVAAAVSAQARREGIAVELVIRGSDTPVDRRVADALFDPVLQLARNAVAHGMESAAVRAARGKPPVGSVVLAAEPRSGGLRLRVEDDGAGVDLARLRSRAIAAGTVSAEMARAVDDQTLLALLFVPGLTTRDSADLLAGRGIGLDLALEAVRRLGGTIRLASEPGMGLSATLDVPLEGGLVKVLWVDAARAAYAVPVQHVRRVHVGRDLPRVYPLARCLEGNPEPAAARFAVELDGRDDRRAAIGVDAIGAIEEVALRGVSPLVLTAGPYAGAIVRGDELRMCLDAAALAELVASAPR
jgi:two-component system chemotaxis sensor kinase CheA